jgi:hypothetical protein
LRVHLNSNRNACFCLKKRQHCFAISVTIKVYSNYQSVSVNKFLYVALKLIYCRCIYT